MFAVALYLTLQRTHRGASWASGAAQAAQVVRIILLRRGVYGVGEQLQLFGLLLVSYMPLARRSAPDLDSS